MIDEHKEELAAMYALGAMEPQEAHAFEEQMRADSELRKFVDDLLHCSAAMVHAIPPKSAPSDLREKCLCKVLESSGAASGAKTGEGKVVPFRAPAFAWLPWALAAGLAVMAGWLVTDRMHLQAQLDDLRNKNDVCQMRISLLDPMEGNHGVATIVWDSSTQTGVLKGDMPRPAANENYQLWVVGDHPQPIPAALVTVDESGGATATFQIKEKVAPGDKFAISVEKKGDTPKPSAPGPIVMSSGDKK